MERSSSLRSCANRCTAVAAALVCQAASASGGGGLIDFETLPGGAPTVDLQEIGAEYASLGVTFELIDDLGTVIGTPNIAKVGAPQTAFASCNGADTPLAGQNVGDSFLTDNTTVGNSGNLRIIFASPVAQAAGVILDVDCRNCNSGGTCGTCEQWTIDAYDALDVLIDTFIIDGAVGSPSAPCNDSNGPGDGKAFGWFFDHGVADISSVVIRYTGSAASVGLAFDNLTPSSIAPLEATARANESIICYGQVTKLMVDALGGVPPYTVTWQRETAPDDWTDIGTGLELDVHPTSDATYRAIVEDVALGSITTNEVVVQVLDVTIEISQESAPGAGDFDSNVLGMMAPFETVDTAPEYYGWTSGSTPFSGPEPALTDNRSHLFLVAGADGLGLYVVHDAAVSAAGGSAETRVDISCDTAAYLVQDDAGLDTFVTANGGTQFDASNSWAANRTDGFAIGGLDCAWTAEMQFADVFSGDPTFSGLDSWVAYSSNGPLAGSTQIPLTLEENRRVRLQAFLICPEDTDRNGEVDVVDLLDVLGKWGPCPHECSADTNCDGEVGVVDLLNVLGAWGPCS